MNKRAWSRVREDDSPPSSAPRCDVDERDVNPMGRPAWTDQPPPTHARPDSHAATQKVVALKDTRGKVGNPPEMRCCSRS